MFCNFAHNILSGIWIEPAPKPEKKAHAPMDRIKNVKYTIPGVFHHRELINAIDTAIVVASNEIENSDVNCQVNAKSSVIDSQILS